MTATVSIDASLEYGVILYYMNKDPEYVEEYARYITILSDLDNNNYKHIKDVYAVGDYGDNTLTLKWTKYSDYSSWNTLASKMADLTAYGDVITWRNLGHARRVAFMLDWSGNSNIAHNAIEVTYNIKTQ